MTIKEMSVAELEKALRSALNHRSPFPTSADIGVYAQIDEINKELKARGE